LIVFLQAILIDQLKAIKEAVAEKERPVLVKVRTTIGYGSANQGKLEVMRDFL